MEGKNIVDIILTDINDTELEDIILGELYKDERRNKALNMIKDIGHNILIGLGEGVPDDKKLYRFISRLSEDVFGSVMMNINKFGESIRISETEEIPRDPKEEIDGIYSFPYPMKKLTSLGNKINVAATMIASLLTKGKRDWESFNKIFSVLVDGDIKTFVKLQTGIEIYKSTFKNPVMSPLVSMAYSVVVRLNEIITPKSYSESEDFLLSEKTINEVEYVSSAIAIQLMKTGLLFPFDIIKRDISRYRMGTKWKYSYTSLTLRHILYDWSIYKLKEESEKEKIKKEAIAVVNTYTALRICGRKNAERDEYSAHVLAQIDEERTLVFKHLYEDIDPGKDGEISVIGITNEVKDIIRKEMAIKKVEGVEIVETSTEEEVISPIVEGEGERPIRKESGIERPDLGIQDIIGKTKKFVRNVSDGVTKVGSAHDKAMYDLYKNAREFENNVDEYKAFLYLVNSTRFYPVEEKTPFGNSKILYYKAITKEEVKDYLRSLRDIGSEIENELDIIGVESSEKDGSIVWITKDGVRIHYDGSTKRKRHSNEYRFEPSVHSSCKE